MTPRIDPASLRDIFVGLRAASDELLSEIVARSTPLRLEAGTAIYRDGDVCSQILLVTRGGIRVFKSGETGREVTLYEVLPGETCILNISCILSGRSYPARAEALGETEGLLMPAPTFRELVDRHAPFREMAFRLLADRLVLMLELVEEITLGRLDKRLAEYLVEKAEDDVVHRTHQAVAADLGTSREVVSRLLKDFERRGKVALGRGEIRLTGISPDACATD